MEGNKTHNPIVPFRQNADFYARSGRRCAEEGDLVSALGRLRRAYDLDPRNPATVVSLAEILNRMQRYEESLTVLFSYGTPEELPEEGLYGAVSDFFGLEEFISAHQCLSLYLEKYPNGRYARSCLESLSVLTDKEEMEWQLGLAEGEDMELIEHVHLSKAMHFSGYDEECLGYLLSLTEQYPDSLWLQMEIALAEYTLGDDIACEQRIINILKKDRFYTRARCMLAYMRLNANKKLEAIEMLEAVPVPDAADFDGLGALSAILLETGMYEKAEICCERFRSSLPYDFLVMHQTAYAKYMLGKADEAAALYRTALAMNPHDTVAKYYLAWMEKHPDPKDGGKGFMTSYDVSYGEALKRFKRIGSLLDDRLKNHKENADDGELLDLIAWGLASPMFRNKKPLFYALSALPGERPKLLLRNYLLSLDQPDTEKQRAFSIYRQLEKTGTVNMYYRGTWRYAVTPAGGDGWPGSYKKLAGTLAALPKTHSLSEEISQTALGVFGKYVESQQGNLPRLDPFKRDAMAAALVFIAGRLTGEETDFETVRGMFGVTKRRMENALEKLINAIGEDAPADEKDSQDKQDL